MVRVLYPKFRQIRFNIFALRRLESSRKFEQWFSSAAGHFLRQQEREWNRDALTKVYGMHLMQLGMSKEDFARQANEVYHSFVMETGGHEEQSWASAEGESEALPIATESLAAVILPHVLEYSDNPHQVLREVTRVLDEDGEVLIYGFSPWSIQSMFGISKGATCLSRRKLMDWLALLGYEVRAQRILPTFTVSWSGSRLNTGAYQLVAKRRVIPLSRIHSRWKRRATVASENYG